MYEYQAVRVHYIALDASGVNIDRTGATQIPGVYVDLRTTDAINLWARAGWELVSVKLVSTTLERMEERLHALLIFRRPLGAAPA